MRSIPFSEGQERILDFIWDRRGCGIFAPPGFGKTRTFLEVANETDGRTLIIAPKLVCESVWPDEIRKWGYQFEPNFMHGRNKVISDKSYAQLDLINYEALPWLAEQLLDLGRSPYKQVIYDELSFLKNSESKRFAALSEIVAMFKYRVGGTGTPCGNHLLNLWAEMYACDVGRSLGKNFYSFRGRYFSKNQYTYKYTTFKGAEEEILDRVSENALSLDINDLNMPALVHRPVYLDMPDDVREKYEELQSSNVIEELDVYAMNAAVKSGKMRQVASGSVIDRTREVRYMHDAKAEWLRAIIDELQGRPCLVFFEWVHDYESICRALGGEVPALYGGTPHGSGARIVRDWNAGKLPVLALHPRCLHPDTLVLTEHRGWVKLIEVSKKDRVWDGVEFVEHGGCQVSGEADVIDKFGVRMTRDHLVLIGDSWVPAENVPDNESARRAATEFVRTPGEHIARCGISNKQIPNRPEKQKVYDLINCGPRSRFVVKGDRGDVFIVHNSAAYGLNMQDSGNVIVWYTITWSLEMLKQGIGRLWRQGQKNKVISHYLMLAGTEDERVYEQIEVNSQLHDRVMEALL